MVGANTVKGPSPDKISVKPAICRADCRVESWGLEMIISAMFCVGIGFVICSIFIVWLILQKIVAQLLPKITGETPKVRSDKRKQREEREKRVKNTEKERQREKREKKREEREKRREKKREKRE